MLATIYTALKVNDENMLGVQYRELTADVVDRQLRKFNVYNAFIMMCWDTSLDAFIDTMVRIGYKYNHAANELTIPLNGVMRHIHILPVGVRLGENKQALLSNVKMLVAGLCFQMAVFDYLPSCTNVDAYILHHMCICEEYSE